MKDKKIKIVEVQYLNYNLSIKSIPDYYKTKDDVKMADYVYCDTLLGIMLARVQVVYETIDDLLKDNKDINLKNLHECRKELNDIYDGLPF